MKFKLMIAVLVAMLAAVFATAPAVAAESHLKAYDSFAGTWEPLKYTDSDTIPATLNGPKDHLLYAGQTAVFTYVYLPAGDDLWCFYPQGTIHNFGNPGWDRVFTATGWHAGGAWSRDSSTAYYGPNTVDGCEYRAQSTPTARDVPGYRDHLSN